MIVSEKYKFVFIHIPKTGGFSVDFALNKHLGEKDLYTNQYVAHGDNRALYTGTNWMHLGVRKVGNKFKNKYKNYYKFAFVRNPYERMVSLYSFFSQLNRGAGRGIPIPPSRDFTPDFEKFRDWLMERNIVVNPRLSRPIQNRWKKRPQIDFLLDEDNNIGVDFVGRTENFVNDLTSVLKHLGIPVETIPHENKSKHLHYSLYYDEETKEKVKKDYIKDLEMFNYDFETNC
tara:strand:+ start:40 stop:732 length:693 start_codon:yes stop_codon:yes gene_type:complete